MFCKPYHALRCSAKTSSEHELLLSPTSSRNDFTRAVLPRRSLPWPPRLLRLHRSKWPCTTELTEESISERAVFKFDRARPGDSTTKKSPVSLSIMRTSLFCSLCVSIPFAQTKQAYYLQSLRVGDIVPDFYPNIHASISDQSHRFHRQVLLSWHPHNSEVASSTAASTLSPSNSHAKSRTSAAPFAGAPSGTPFGLSAAIFTAFSASA